MLGYLIALFVVVPLVELFLLIELGRLIGTWPTVGLVVFTGTLGAWLARRQGRSAWRAIKFDLSVGNMPADNIVSGLLVVVAGLLLVTPGVITDLVGFSLLAPPVRERAVGRLKKYFQRRIRITLGRRH